MELTGPRPDSVDPDGVGPREASFPVFSGDARLAGRYASGRMQEADGAATRSALGKGRRLFNSGRFFEAHEVWEEAWLREEGETRRLLQGLIQIAAGYHHAFHTRQARGCVRLLETGLDRLHALADGGDLALDAFRQAVTLSLERARSWERGQSVGLSRAEAPRLGLSKE